MHTVPPRTAPAACSWYRQAELQNARWAMLGVAGILGQEVFNPEQWWYSAGMPENLPRFDGNTPNLGEWRRQAVKQLLVMVLCGHTQL